MLKSNKLKKLSCIFFSLLFIFCSVPFSASAANIIDAADYKYTVTENDEAQITGLKSMWLSGELHIPEVIDGYPVTSIKSGAFNSGTYISVAVIPASVTDISPNTFGKAFVSITVDEANPNYASDENGVLFNKEMTVLIEYPSAKTATSYTVPDGVTKIDEFAFQDSVNLENVILPESITTIETQAFYKCTKLADVNIPSETETIDKLAFADTAIKSFSLGKNLSSTTGNAYNTTALEKITVDEANLYYCSDEYGILYDKAQTEVLCFPTCYPYTEYRMPDSVTEYNSDSINQTLKKLYLSKNYYEATTIFSSFPSLEEIHAHNESKYYSSEDGILFSKDKDTLCFVPCSVKIKIFSIPESVTELSSLCFVYNSTVEEVIIPDSVTALNSAFNNCKALKKIVIPESVTNLSYQFVGCSALREIYLPSTLLTIGTNTFYSGHASGISDIYFAGTKAEWDVLAVDVKISNTVNIHYNYGAVTGECGENAIWSFNEISRTLTISGSGEIDEKPGFEEYGWNNFKDSIAYVEIIDSITNIPANAFNGCENLNEVYLGKNVSTIGEDAFSGCSSLLVFASHSDNISIADSAFNGCNEKLTFICPSTSSLIALVPNKAPCITVSFDGENSILKFNGSLTVYNGPKYDFLSIFLNEHLNSNYIYFEKIIFDGVSPDVILPDFEGADNSAQNLTLTNLYINLAVVRGDSQENITFEEMLELLESGNYDAFKYIIESDDIAGEKTFLQKVEDFFVSIGENALRAISSVINFIAKLFRRK